VRVSVQRSTLSRNYYDPDRRTREHFSSSLDLVLFRKNRVGFPFIKVNQIFEKIFQASLLGSCRFWHFVDGLQTIYAGADSAAAAGDCRDAHP